MLNIVIFIYWVLTEYNTSPGSQTYRQLLLVLKTKLEMFDMNKSCVECKDNHKLCEHVS